ncbi:MAG TPA: HTTM domain-containing protein, partial [Polyangiaceae bacterium]|nr:HTTM domain-containing protein [Polyangiaceae bacterium]
FVGTWLLAIGDGGASFALLPSIPRSPRSSAYLVHSFVASVYAWSAIAKLRVAWLTGITLRALHDSHFLRGALADALFATPGRCCLAAWGVVVAELALGPLLLVRRTRVVGLFVAAAMHAAYEWTAHPDVFAWVMAALLISFWPRSGRRAKTLASASGFTTAPF